MTPDAVHLRAEAFTDNADDARAVIDAAANPSVLAGASAYAAAADGIVPWRSRPEIFRKQSLARIPPILSPVLPASEAAE